MEREAKMHTTEGNKVRFLHNGDYSGDVEIVDKATGEQLAIIPFTDLAALVAGWVYDMRLAHLEQASTSDILFGRSF